MRSRGGGEGGRAWTTDSLEALGMCNRAIDVASRPLLVERLGAQSPSCLLDCPGVPRARNRAGGWRTAAAALTTAEYLSRHGMETSALDVLCCSGNWQSKAPAAMGAEAGAGARTGEAEAEVGPRVGKGASSTCDPVGGMVDRGGGGEGGLVSGEITGDMFSAFDAPVPRRVVAGQREGRGQGQGQGQAQSLDTDPLLSGELSGGIFGGFDAPSPSVAAAPAPAPAPAPSPSPPMSSSAIATGELGDMFGAFDSPPQTKQRQEQWQYPEPLGAPAPSPSAPGLGESATTASAELGEGGLFGGFDVTPPTPMQRKSWARAGVREATGDSRGTSTSASPARATVESGELTGDMFGAFDWISRGKSGACGWGWGGAGQPGVWCSCDIQIWARGGDWEGGGGQPRGRPWGQVWSLSRGAGATGGHSTVAEPLTVIAGQCLRPFWVSTRPPRPPHLPVALIWVSGGGGT
ncbi:unnamed protein product [Discosporangium mesarthrocarpum]